eukprot:CAMPEP_0115719248 /NCGR_PEP_ID=MMETSP0272-20121206/77874_1 /TAXON_ID=71861 /ORGANISM="Scrippsiella trochoidea, Strain CCMP3099" /LENGTH=173 /DNA_ID=CAMNT_0003161853 /DNA_START=143 /DNA_END=661 /DNA_ORIENTATION=-
MTEAAMIAKAAARKAEPNTCQGAKVSNKWSSKLTQWMRAPEDPVGLSLPPLRPEPPSQSGGGCLSANPLMAPAMLPTARPWQAPPSAPHKRSMDRRRLRRAMVAASYTSELLPDEYLLRCRKILANPSSLSTSWPQNSAGLPVNCANRSIALGAGTGKVATTSPSAAATVAAP